MTFFAFFSLFTFFTLRPDTVTHATLSLLVLFVLTPFFFLHLLPLLLIPPLLLLQATPFQTRFAACAEVAANRGKEDQLVFVTARAKVDQAWGRQVQKWLYRTVI
jgi:hypothetical protein